MKEHLFLSGPVNLQKSIRKAVYGSRDIGHREPEFTGMLKQIRAKLLKVFGANKRDYSAIVFTGSATSAMEAVLAANIHKKKKALIITNGQFGERFVEIAKVHKIAFKQLEYGWGEPIKAGDVARALRGDKAIEAVVMTYHETSSAIINPVHDIGALAKKHKKLFIVDCISAVGGEPVDVVRDNIDFAIGTSAKALEGMPVLGIACVKKSAIEKIRDIRPRCFYLDLVKHYDYAEQRNQTPFTPAIPLFFALNQALDDLFSEGLKKRRARYKKNAGLLRAGLKKMGLGFYLPKEYRSNIVAYVMLPDGIKFKPLYAALKKKGFLIYPGKGPLEEKAMHIANIGAIDEKEINKFLSALRTVVRQLKKPKRKKIKHAD